MKNVFITISSLVLALFFTVGLAVAADCNIYGGGTNCSQNGPIEINKTVQNPRSSSFVDNLGINDTKFTPGQTVTFHIVLTNTSNSSVSNIKAKDIFPTYLTYVSGGSWDAGAKTVNMTVDKLDKNQSKTFEIKAKVVDRNKLPSQNVTCIVNQANVTANNKTSQDNSQFCISQNGQTSGTENSPTPTPTYAPTTKGGQPIYTNPSTTTTPATGPEALGLVGLVPVGAIGILLRKKTV